MPIDQARSAIAKAFTAVVRGGAYSAQAAKREFGRLDTQQRRFALKLLNETLDRIYFIDYCLEGLIDISATADALMDILRLGVCQLYFMDSVPDHAAIDSTVELTKAQGFERQAGFVNGVLRNVLRNKDTLRLPAKVPDFDRYLAIKYSWPLWMAHMFYKQLGPADAESFMAYRPDFHMTIRPNALKGLKAGQLEKVLTKAGVAFEHGALVEDAFKIKSADNLASSPLFQKGLIAIQGEGSQLVAKLCANAAGKGSDILDACAAPGGKTAAVASNLDGDCRMTAWDVHEHRLELIRQTCQRLGAEVQIELHDAGLKDDRQFDMVLVDAPCSGLGVAYNSPDIKIQRKQRELDSVVALQRRILHNVAALVRPGGHLLYSTCTISKQENENNIGWFLREHKNFSGRTLRDYLPPEVAGEGHMLQLLPHKCNAEGFFMALLRKTP